MLAVKLDAAGRPKSHDTQWPIMESTSPILRNALLF